MKLFYTAIIAVIIGLVLFCTGPVNGKSLLGAKQCTWGPSYWCSNLTNAKNCNAVRHCIQTVWEKQTVPEDNDSICQICLDMVKQARDQLESNETQTDLKNVFEGSCKLIPLKPIKKECIKLADDFVPELVEALASQMNPQVVCSVAGLCNNARIDEMLVEMEKTTTKTAEVQEVKESSAVPVINVNNYNENKKLTCSGCNTIASVISDKFHSNKPDDILQGFLRFCGRLSSYSDACSNTVITNFDEIYNELNVSMNSDAICHMSGVCYEKYHKHPELVEIRPLSNVGVVHVNNDDIPCELCEQLVRHLRDLLVANTTETEFKQVLEGFCKQTKGFKEECISIVDQYYDEIYNTLVNNLDENSACFIIGVCPKNNNLKSTLYDDNVPIAPLLPILPAQPLKVTIKEIPNKNKNTDDKNKIKRKMLKEQPKLSNEEIQSLQLPIDRLLGAQNPEILIKNGELCTFCEYFLHFLQEALSSPKNEDKIKDVVYNSCHKLPTSIRGKCDDFVDMYADAIIALLIQQIDPAQICPMLKICPSNVEDMEVFAPQPINVKINSKSSTTDKPTCPLCLFAVQQAQEMIKNDKTKESIKHALDSLCVHLPKKLQAECIDFVETYSSELVQMLMSDFTPQEICVYLKLCANDKPDLGTLSIRIDYNEDNEILTNEITDFTVNGKPIKTADKEGITSPECMLCQRIIKEAEKKIINPKSKEQIKHALQHACDKLHSKKLTSKCHNYIEKNGDLIVNLLMKELTPKMICREIGYCVIGLDNDDESHETDNISGLLKIDIITIPISKQMTYEDFYEAATASSEENSSDDIKEISDNPPCIICEFVMSKLEQELQNKTTQDDIKNTIKSICKKLPKTIEKNCNTFISDYADLILNLIDSVPPKEICQSLALCKAKNNEELLKNQSKKLKHIDDEVIDCGLCYGITNSLMPTIKESEKESELQQMIDIACNNFDAKYYRKCSQLIQFYGESIINLVKKGEDETKICIHIGKCFENEHSQSSYLMLQETSDAANSRVRRSPSPQTDNGKQQLLGAKKCTWGPSYWCDDKSKAEECGAVQYCVEKVWGAGAQVKNN